MRKTSKDGWLEPYRKLMDTQINCFKFVGFWELDAKDPWIARQAYFLYNKLMLTIMFSFAITLLADICSSIDDLSITTDDGCIFAGIFVVLFKTMNFQFRRREIARLMEDTVRCGEELCHISTGNFKSILDTFILRNKISFYGFSVLGFFLVVALIFFSPSGNGGLPIRARYPYDTTKSPWHEIGFSIEMFAVSGGMVAIISIDSIAILLCNLMTLQLDILSMNFENCSRKIQTYPYKRCLRFHQRLGLLLKDYNKIFRWGVFIQMLSSTSMICLTGFQAVVVGGQSSNVLKFGIYLSAAVSQLLYVCWVGNELTYSSSMMEKSQWLSEWDNESLSAVARLLMLSMMFSRQSFKIKAGIFFTLSLETFIAILRGSYSFFTLLNNLHSSGER